MENRPTSKGRPLKTSQTRLREEDDDSIAKTPEKKRLRVSRACDQCRRKKDRCDGQRPMCQQCSDADRTCTYDLSTKKRGLPLGYVRAMEILLGLVFRHVEGSESMVSEILAVENGMILQRSQEQCTDPASTTTLLNVWRKSGVIKQMENRLPVDSAEDDDAFMQRLDSSLADVASAMADRQRDLDNVSLAAALSCDNASHHEAQVLNAHTPLQDAADLSYRINLHGSPQSVEHRFASRWLEDRVQLPPQWSQLLDIYFANTHCWFPISQKHDLLRPAYMLANVGSDQSYVLSSGVKAFLWAVFAYTVHQSRASQTISLASSTSQIDNFSAEALFSRAQYLVSLELPVYEPGHVQALLILSLLQIGRTSWTSAWVFVGRAVYIAIELHIIPQSSQGTANDFPTSLDDGKKRVALACFILDTLISARLDRRPHLKRSDLSSIGLPHSDHNDEWEAWQPSTLRDGDRLYRSPSHQQVPARTLSIFNQFSTLIAILNDFLCGVDSTLSLSSARELFHDLNSWREQLPAHCQLSTDAVPGTVHPERPQVLNLHLAYIMVTAILKLKTHAVSPTISYSIVTSPELHLLTLTAVNVRTFGPVSLPPTFETFFSFLDQSLALQCKASFSKENLELRSKVSQLAYEVKEFWCGSQALQEGPPKDPSTPFLPLVLPPSAVETYVTLFEGSNIIDQLQEPALKWTTLHSATNSNENLSPTFQPPPQTNHQQSLSRETTLFNVVENPANPLVIENHDDGLFTSLALLDPVDW